jgi:bacillopeptidase F (M6 metalloprotease family)
MAGHEPTAAALDDLTTALERHLDKATIAVQSPTEITAGGQDRYTAEEIRDLEATHRDHYTQAEGETLWAHILVVDGRFEQTSVVGIAYQNTSTAFFGATIDEISGGLTQPSEEKEATVFRHEFGHNLGLVANGTPLVANGTPMEQDHQDEDNGAHCTEEACVMYHAIETTDYFANVFDGDVPDFRSFCSDDMAAQRAQ